MAKKEYAQASDLDDFNSNDMSVSEESGSNVFEAVVKVALFQMQSEIKEGKTREFINIQLIGVNPQGTAFTAFKKQFLNRADDGRLKNWLFEGGTTKDKKIIFPSIAWEIKELAKEQMGIDAYKKLKNQLGNGKLNRACFEAMEITMNFKKITAKETGDVFYLAQFAYDKAKDEEYRKSHQPDGAFSNDEIEAILAPRDSVKTMNKTVTREELGLYAATGDKDFKPKEQVDDTEEAEPLPF